MKTYRSFSVAGALFAAAIAFAMPAQAADVAAGKAKADQVCAACHGKDGNTPIDPSYPKLAGQWADYLERALLDYQLGNRQNPIMAPMAKQLTRAEVTDVAAYYSQLPGQMMVRCKGASVICWKE